MLKKILFFILILPVILFSLYTGFITHNSKEMTLEYAGLARKYRIHYPTGFDKNKNYPLVVALHGFSHDARVMELYTGLSKKADEEKFVVVYPYSYKKKFLTAPSWNSGFCCGYAFENNVDDVGFLKQLIENIEGQGGIDESRIYIAGFSNGAFLGNLLAMTIPEKIAAVAQVAGSVGGKYEDDEVHSYIEQAHQPVSAIVIHGRNDEVVRFEGGEGRYKLVDFYGAYDSLTFWLDNNSCSKHPAEVSNQENITKEVYNECDNSTVEFYAGNSDHTWPGSLDDLSNLITGKSINTTDIVWEFFSRNKK